METTQDWRLEIQNNIRRQYQEDITKEVLPCCECGCDTKTIEMKTNDLGMGGIDWWCNDCWTEEEEEEQDIDEDPSNE